MSGQSLRGGGMSLRDFPDDGVVLGGHWAFAMTSSSDEMTGLFNTNV